MNTALVVPTLNAGFLWKKWLDALGCQSVRADREIVFDSSSTDDTAHMAREAGLQVRVIARKDFNHGGTRQAAVELCADADVILFLTQDALLADSEAIGNLLRCFENFRVGAAYGRQLPHINAGPIGAHARVFNYPAESRVRTIDDRFELGIKTAFISNSFAAYRRSALMDVGGFPNSVIFGEDTFAAARMLKAGWAVAYCAEARVHHSHDYSIREDFCRSFDIGVFHARESWLQETFGRAEKEGARFVRSELSYLARQQPLLLPSAIIRTGMKLVGYRLGRMEARLPLALKRRLSMSKTYWNQISPGVSDCRRTD